MKWLTRLKKQEVLDTQATKPTEPVFVGFVAFLPGLIQKIEGATAANEAESAAQLADPNRWCWPHSAAMNAAETYTFTGRLVRFTDKGLSATDGEAMADRMTRRDRDLDDRRMCLECVYLKGAGRWHCSNWQRAGVAAEGLAPDLVLTRQRCDGFKEVGQ